MKLRAAIGRFASAVAARRATALGAFGVCASLVGALAHADTFVVDTTEDDVDVSPGDGVCLSGGGTCTLRAAVMEANAFAGADVIDLTAINDPANPITLTLDGVDETFTATSSGDAPCTAIVEADASIGDLDVTESVSIQGSGPALTVVRWDVQSATDPNVGDRIFHVQSLSGGSVDGVRFSGLRVENGSVGIAATLDATNVYNCEVTGASPSRKAWQFRRFGGGIAVGGGAAVVLFDEALHAGANAEPVRPEDDGSSDIDGVELAEVAVVGNWSGADGGGLDSTVRVGITDSVFSDNEADGAGGGLRLGAGGAILRTLIGDASSDVPFASAPLPAALLGPNLATSGGGLFATGLATTTVDYSAVNLNHADAGGGMAGRLLSTVNLSSSTVSGNIAEVDGAGITTSGNVNLRGATIANNRVDDDATTGGAGLNSFSAGSFLFLNTILSNNTFLETGSATASRDSNCGCTARALCPSGAMISTGFNLGDETANNCSLSSLASDQLSVDPLLGALANNGGLTETHRLPSTTAGDAATSPAIDKGDDLRCTNNDQRGSVRPDDGEANGTPKCDVGAFELFIPRADLNIANVQVPDRVSTDTPFEMTVVIKNDDVDTAMPGVTYTGTVTPTTGLSVLGADSTAGTCTVAANVITCALGDMAESTSATVTLTLAAVEQNDYKIVSVVANAAGVTDPKTSNNTITSLIKALGTSDIELSVTLDRPSAKVEEDFTLDYLVENHGADDASNIRLRIILPPSVIFFSASYPPTNNNCVLVLREIVCLLTRLDAGEEANFNLIVTADDVGAWEFEATTVVEQEDPDSSNNVVDTAISIEAAAASGGGGGGCAYNPGSPVDPTLPGLLAFALAVLLLRRSRAAPVRIASQPGGD
jgi:CSLREA domain-containing protein